MKLIHCADLHLGSALSSRLPADKARIRKGEVRAAFSAMVDYAAREGIGVILLAGDVFDSDHPARKDKEFFYSVVKNNPAIDFLYLRGNHDRRSVYDQELPNLKTFGPVWRCYRYGDVAIYGLELEAQNQDTLYDSFQARREEVNIALLHGQTADSPGPDRICLARLREKQIDYLALGHVHSRSAGNLDSRGIWCYPGCLEGRGYDEVGEKGFVVVDTHNLKKLAFVAQSRRVVRRVTVDLSESGDLYQACRLVEQALPESSRDLLRLELTGELTWEASDLAREIASRVEERFFHVSVKDLTTRRIRVEDYMDSVSLAGEFLRQVMAQEGLSEEDRQAVMELGLRALKGGEVNGWD